jgi:hypothetical protein
MAKQNSESVPDSVHNSEEAQHVWMCGWVERNAEMQRVELEELERHCAPVRALAEALDSMRMSDEVYDYS